MRPPVKPRILLSTMGRVCARSSPRTLMRTLTLVLLAVLTSGCAARIRNELLTGTWTELCPGGSPREAHLRFLDNGRFKFSYPAPDAWQGDNDETWTVRGRRITVSWNGGFASSEYTVKKLDAKRYEGTSSKAACAETIALRRGKP